ncbi:hypothetical protein ALQ20_03880, partial [Pseudomonas syringae pv. atrofaciens]
MGGNGEQVLNKLVQAIRNILNNLLSLLEGNLQNGSGPAQTQREQTPTLAQSPSPSSSSSSPSTPQGNAEKPFVVQNDHPSEKPVSLQKNTEPTSAAPSQTADRTAERSSATPDKTPAGPDAVNPAVVNDPALPKTSTDTTKTDNTVKAAKTVTPAAHGQGADMSGIVG